MIQYKLGDYLLFHNLSLKQISNQTSIPIYQLQHSLDTDGQSLTLEQLNSLLDKLQIDLEDLIVYEPTEIKRFDYRLKYTPSIEQIDDYQYKIDCDIILDFTPDMQTTSLAMGLIIELFLFSNHTEVRTKFRDMLFKVIIGNTFASDIDKNEFIATLQDFMTNLIQTLDIPIANQPITRLSGPTF